MKESVNLLFMSKNNKRGKKDSQVKWLLIVLIMTFALSMFFSFISTTSISNLSVIPAIIILILVILIGVLFDIIGVAVTCATEEEFHAMASKKVK